MKVFLGWFRHSWAGCSERGDNQPVAPSSLAACRALHAARVTARIAVIKAPKMLRSRIAANAWGGDPFFSGVASMAGEPQSPRIWPIGGGLPLSFGVLVYQKTGFGFSLGELNLRIKQIFGYI
jgi:hypothetical protein